jgi:hypothetical protein
MGAPKQQTPEKKNPLAATHDWVLVMNEKGKKSFQWVPKNK